jgi:anion-transporting  ArsA/GET3 family ATPase
MPRRAVASVPAAAAGASVPSPMAGLMAGASMVLVTGSGGVGKTTTSAALGTQVARTSARRVLVLTVDPARRLATALGVTGELGDQAQVVPAAALTALGPGAGVGSRPLGELSIAMLDTKRGWDELIRRHAPDSRTRDSILANPLYDGITSRFVQSHDYLAMERLFELHQSGRYDLVVVDTPPSRSALDILDAPEHMADFFGGRLLRWLTVPYRSRLFTVASKPFYQVADRILGSRFLEDIAQFFVLFQSMEKGFVGRARLVGDLLTDPATSFVVVSTLEPAPAREAEYLMAELVRRDLPLGALVLNKVLPAWLRDPAGAVAAGTIASRSDALAAALHGSVPALARTGPEAIARVLAEVAASHGRLRSAAEREAEELARLAAAPKLTVALPHLSGDVTDLDALARLGDKLWAPRSDQAD